MKKLKELLLLILIFQLCACSSGNAVLKEEYDSAFPSDQANLICEYFAAYKSAFQSAKDKHDIFIMLENKDDLLSIYDKINTRLSTDDNENATALKWEISSLETILETINAAKLYQDVLASNGGSYGVEGISRLAVSLKIISADDVGFKSINEIQDIVIGSIEKKIDAVDSQYFN